MLPKRGVRRLDLISNESRLACPVRLPLVFLFALLGWLPAVVLPHA